MAQVSAQPTPSRTARRSPLEFVVDRTWRFFCSVRAAVFEIVVLAILVLVGTLRGSSVPRRIADTIPATEPIVDRWYAWDVFHSLPFMAILTLIAVAITICTLNRVPAIWGAIAHPTVTTTYGFIRNAETSARVSAQMSASHLATQIGMAFRAGRYRVLTEERGGETHLYADRFRYAKLGTFPFHLALILILVGGIVGARYGFRETEFILAEGSVRELGHGTDLSVRLDDFSETYRENGIAKEFRSDLTLLEDGKAVETGSATVNNPLTHGGIAFYQSGFGQAAVLRVTDSHDRVLFDDALALGQFRSKANPDAPAGVLDLPAVGVTLHVIGPDENPASAPEKDDLRLRSGEMYLQLRPLGPQSPIAEPMSGEVDQGDKIALGPLSVEFVRERRFTVLQVARNPGIPIFFAAALLLVGGLAVTFYFPHRRVRGIIAATADGGSQAILAPLARRDWSGRRAFERLLDEVEARLEGGVVRRDAPARQAVDGALPVPDQCS